MDGEGGGSVNDGFYKTMQETAKQLDAWKDKHLSVPFPERAEARTTCPRWITSFPQAPREYRGLQLRNGLGGARRS